MATASCPNTLPARIASLPATRAKRRAVLVLLSSACLSLAALGSAAPAGAFVRTVTGTKVGLQPRSQALGEGSPETFANHGAIANTGGGVLHGTNVYAIYWDPKNLFHHEWLVNIDQFFQRMGASSGSLTAGFSALGQYRDRTNTGAAYKTTFMGAYSDTAKYPAAGCKDPNPAFTAEPVTCLNDTQVREQLASFIVSHGLSKGMNTIFYVLTPPGVAVCIDEAATRCSDYKVSISEEEKEERGGTSYAESFCSYHSDISPTNEQSGDGNTILYAMIPWSAGTAGAGSLAASRRVYKEAFDCQDGGWNPEGNSEVFEKPKEQSKAEKEAFEKASSEEKIKIERRILLEKPHEQQPNQAGKGEEGDYGSGLADLIINQIAVEHANTVTDPLLNAWQDEGGGEVTDQCRNVFASTVTAAGGGSGIQGSVTADEHTEAGTLSNMELSSPELLAAHYYINNFFSLGGECVGGVGLVPRFTAPDPVNTQEIVTFDGMESTVGLLEGLSFAPTGPPSKAYATYSWNFGDGTPEVTGFAPGAPVCETPWLSPCAASALHTFQYGGKYIVTLTVTDVGGNSAHITHPLQVAGPPAPAPGAGAGKAGAGTTSGAGAPPSATVVVLSRSLRQVLRSGLLISYSVSERVTGRFEVLLDKKVGHKLHLRAPSATGLAQGTAAQMVIGKSILVTLGGGRSRMRIQLPGSITSRLAHTRSVALILRLVVRNAAGGDATIVTPLKLSH